eukprot:Amastigsp_a512407_34.p3 type:complete len:177 gc:universal Amastigsp_a512407_34:157-687(+)
MALRGGGGGGAAGSSSVTYSYDDDDGWCGIRDESIGSTNSGSFLVSRRRRRAHTRRTKRTRSTQQSAAAAMTTQNQIERVESGSVDAFLRTIESDATGSSTYVKRTFDVPVPPENEVTMMSYAPSCAGAPRVHTIVETGEPAVDTMVHGASPIVIETMSSRLAPMPLPVSVTVWPA